MVPRLRRAPFVADSRQEPGARAQGACARGPGRQGACRPSRGDALENVVSAFDGFGREVCAKNAADIPFQNLSGARRKVQDVFGFDFADGLTPDEWDTACRVFQKRHLLAHKMGVVDEDYVRKSGDVNAVVGRKVSIGRDEIKATLGIVEALGKRLFAGILSLPH